MQAVSCPAIQHTVYVNRDGFLVKVEMASPPMSMQDVQEYLEAMLARGYTPANIPAGQGLETPYEWNHQAAQPRQTVLDRTPSWDPSTLDHKPASGLPKGAYQQQLKEIPAPVAPAPPQTIICPEHHVPAELRTAKDNSGDQWYSHKIKGTNKWHRIDL